MYATVEQANQYIQTYYSSVDPLRKSWEELADGDKQVLLNRAEQFVDCLPLKGKALVKGKAFPREPYKEESLEQAKVATIELAVQSLDTEASERMTLQKQGVKSYRIGDLSETFADRVSGLDYAGLDPHLFSIVFPFLKDWLGGGYRICPTHTEMFPGRRILR